MKTINKQIRAISIVLIIMLVNIGFSQQNDLIGTSPKAPNFDVSKTGAVLFDQISNTGVGFMTSHEFTVTEKTKTCAAADDFDIPEGESWDIHSVAVLGTYFSGSLGGGDTVNVHILADNNGIPGDTLHEYLDYTNIQIIEEDVAGYIQTYIEVTLPATITLTEGTYWLSVQMVSDQVATGQWGWNDHNTEGVIYGAEWHWKNPKNGWEMGAIDWTSASVLVGPWLQWELSFAIYGVPLDNDVAALSITSPEDFYYGPPVDEKDVIVIIKNEGPNPQTGFDVKYNFNGTEVTENIGSVTLEYNDFYEYTFTEKVDLSTPGYYDLSVSTMLVGDENADNDTQELEITVFDPTEHQMPSGAIESVTACSGTFTDAGGLEGNLTVDDWGILTIYPENPGDKIKLEFVQFDIDWSDFWIYDGENTLAPELGYWENDQNPGTILAGYQNISGALTIHFVAQPWTPFDDVPGWAAILSCHTPLEDDFAVLGIELSHPSVFEYDYVTAYASIKNIGTTIIEKDVTFSANGIDFGTASTGMVTQSDTVIVEVIWNPSVTGEYEIIATIPDDGGNTDNSASMTQFVHPFDYFYQGFELPLFPPDGWSQTGTAWTHHTYSPAVGNGHAYLWVEYGLYDTLTTPKLHIEEGDLISFYAYSSAWWPGEMDLCWIDAETGVATLIASVPLPYVTYQTFEYDVSAAAGDNYLCFVGKYNPMGGQGELKLDEVKGEGIELFFYADDLKAYTVAGNTTPEENVATTLNVDIKNIGFEFVSGSDYTVRLMQEPGLELMTYAGQDLNPKEVLDFTMEYAFPYAGLYQCYVEVDFPDDESQMNNTSSKLDVYVQQEGTVQVQVGTGNDYETNWSHPITIGTTGNYAQTLYRAEDVGDPNTITGIMYYYYFGGNYPFYDNPVTIFMNETEENDMQDSLVAMTPDKLVFEGTFDAYPGYHGVYIPLDFVYSYQGGNLMVTTYKDFNQGGWGEFYIGTTHTPDTMVRYFNGYENNTPFTPYDQQLIDSLYLHQREEFANTRFFKFNLEGQYCTPQTLNGTVSGDYIDGVSFGEIQNLGTGSQGGPAYNNYTSMSANLERDRAYELTIQAETSGANGSISAWIDFNGNQSFDDEGEQIVHITSVESSQEITVLVNVPADAALGLTLLRVRNSSNADLFASCEAVDYGETEDYGINIIETIQVYNPVPDFTATIEYDGSVDLNWSVPENTGKAYIEGFEMSTWPPQGGWEVKQSTTIDGILVDPTGDTWGQYNEDMDLVYNGAFSALSPASAMDFNWLITPDVQLYGNDELSFMLNYSADASGYSKFYVLVESDGVWTTELEYTDEVTMYNNFEEQVTVSLNEYAGKIVRLAFVSQYNDAYPIAIDDAILKGVDPSDKSVSGITGYDIYRNGEMFAEIMDASVVTYPDLLDVTENYIYCISVKYDDGEKSEELCDEVFYLAPLTPPMNVVASAVNTDVTVMWIEPHGGMMRFNDDFEDYNAGEQVACQNPEDWTTWTLSPCGNTDPFISTDFAYNGDNSVLNEGESDLLYLNDELLEEGKHSFNFRLYIPEGFNGYFNVLQDHNLTAGALWGMQAFFDAYGIGTLDAGGYGAATFTYEYDEWMYVEVVMNLDIDMGQFLINGELIHQWQWSTAIGGNGGWNTFEGADFYSWNTNGLAKFYVDDVQLIQLYETDALQSYNVYRNGDLLGNTNSTTYEDNGINSGVHTYCVSAVYDEGESEQDCDMIFIISAPENFDATVENENDVNCSWDEISGTGFQGYFVYRNEEQVSGLVTSLNWTDENVEGGTHNYYVTSVFESAESLPSNDVDVIILISPSNLLAVINNENIDLEWEGVGNVIAGNMVELYQHDGTPVNGLYEWFDFGYGVVFDISAYEGASIETVDFHHSSYGLTGNWSYMFHVVDMTTFEEIDFAGPFQTAVEDDWEFDIDLGSLTSTSNLIGIFLEPMSNDPQDAYPILSLDEELNGNSIQVSTDDYTLFDPTIGDFLLNLWIFAPVSKELVKAPKISVDNSGINNARNAFTPVKGEIDVNQNEKASKALTGYNVYYAYDQGTFELLENVIDTTYSHEGMAIVNGVHSYYVTSTYEEGESGASNTEDVLIDGIENTTLGSDLVYPNPFTNEVNVKLEENIIAVKVINAQGQVVFEEAKLNSADLKINLENEPTGIYNLRIETENGWTNHKMIKK